MRIEWECKQFGRHAIHSEYEGKVWCGAPFSATLFVINHIGDIYELECVLSKEIKRFYSQKQAMYYCEEKLKHIVDAWENGKEEQ